LKESTLLVERSNRLTIKKEEINPKKKTITGISHFLSEDRIRENHCMKNTSRLKKGGFANGRTKDRTG
jgi:hypothetical protein